MNRLLTSMAVLSLYAAGEALHPGAKVPEFHVSDVAGKAASLGAFRGQVAVVAFVSAQCPISNGYNDRMSSLYRKYSGHGVAFLFVNSNSNEPQAEIVEHARQAGFPFTVYRDSGNRVSDIFGASATPETFVIDREGILRYHGYVDDAVNEARVKNPALRAAIDAVLAGRPVEPAETKAFGCTIKRARRDTPGS